MSVIEIEANLIKAVTTSQVLSRTVHNIRVELGVHEKLLRESQQEADRLRRELADKLYQVSIPYEKQIRE